MRISIDSFFIFAQIFVVILKLLGEITWSWWAVFIPLYIYLAILLYILIIGGFLLLCLYMYEKSEERKVKIRV